MNEILLYKKLSGLSDKMKVEVANFIDLISSKNRKPDKKKKPKFGSGKGMFKMKSGFDEPLDDFREYMQ